MGYSIISVVYSLVIAVLRINLKSHCHRCILAPEIRPYNIVYILMYASVCIYIARCPHWSIEMYLNQIPGFCFS